MARNFLEFIGNENHLKSYPGGGKRGKPDIEEITKRKRQGADATLALANIAKDKNNGKGGIIACGIDFATGEEDVYIVELFSEKTKASKKIEQWQQELNRDNDRPNTLILVYDHDEMIRYRANHPKAEPQDYINAALAQLADANGIGAMIDGKTVKKDIIDELINGVRDDRPFSISEDVVAANGETARVSFICPGNVSKNYKMIIPGAGRIFKEKNISDKALRRMIINHENGHANDSQKADSYSTLDILKNRSDTEKMADINTVREAFIKGDKKQLDAALFFAYWRVESMAGALFRQAYVNAVLSGDIPEVLEENELRFVKEHDLLAKDPQNKPKTAGRTEKAFDDLDERYNAAKDKLYDLSEMGLSVAYDNAALLIGFITEMKTDRKFRKKITGMSVKEFDEFFPKYRAEHDGGKEAFGKQILDSLEVRLVTDESGKRQVVCPDNANIKKVFELKEKLEKEFGVTQDEIDMNMTFDIMSANGIASKKIKEAAEKRGLLKELLHSGDNVMEEKAEASDMRRKADAEFRFFDDFYRKIERESIRNGGNETAAFDKVWVVEHNNFASGCGGYFPYDKYLMEKLDEVKIKYRDEARKRIGVFKEANAKFKEAETPASDIANLSGDALTAAYAVNRILQMDRAEKALVSALNFKSDPSVFEDLVKTEKLVQAYAAKIKKDDMALETAGDWRSIIRGEVDDKSEAKNNIPGWIANLGAAVRDEGNAPDMEALRSRINESRRLFAIEITENDAIATKIKDADPQLAARLEKIAAAGKEKADNKKTSLVIPTGFENGYGIVFKNNHMSMMTARIKPKSGGR